MFCFLSLFCFMSLTPLIQLPQTEKWENLMKTKFIFQAFDNKNNVEKSLEVFLGPIWLPKVSFWGLWGLVCIEKWSLNFHCNLNAIFDTHKMARVTPLVVVHFLSGASPKKIKFVSHQMWKLHTLQLREGRKEIMPF